MTGEPVSRKPRVVILGGGFAGVYTAIALEKALRGRDDFEIVLVSLENYWCSSRCCPR